MPVRRLIERVAGAGDPGCRSGGARRRLSYSFRRNGFQPWGGKDRRSPRVGFERGVAVQMMAIDGTWRRDCTLQDISDSGARLSVNGSFEGLELKEFFLLLSSRGLVYRRCRLIRLNGDEIGVEFLTSGRRKTRANPAEVEV